MPAYDPALRRRVKRGKQRERGVWLYVAAEELERAGYRPDEPLPFYRCGARHAAVCSSDSTGRYDQ